MHVTKQQLGEGYVVSTSVVLAGILLGMLVSQSPDLSPWVVAPGVSVVGLVALSVWFHRLTLDGEQVWNVAMYAAVGIGTVTVLLVGVLLGTRTLRLSVEVASSLTVLVATGTASGVLLGVSVSLQRRTQELTLRNAVLYRLLRHNLRNDMSVVLAQLEDVKREVDGPERGKIEQAEQKIHGLVELTDKVRQLNLMLESGTDTRTPIDLVATIEQRVGTLRQTYPDSEIRTSLPAAAYVTADRQFGIVIDNVVESAVRAGREPPELTIECECDDREVRLRITDHSGALPEQDLSVIEAETVQQLDHGDSMELWLVYWLVEYNGGSLTVDTDGETRRISITLDRTRRRGSRVDDVLSL